MSNSSPLSSANEIILKKKILSIREHYDLEDRNGNKLGEADGNLFQFPAKFVIHDNTGAEFMHIEGKILSLRKEYSFFDNVGTNLGVIKKKLIKLIGEEYWIEKGGAEYMRIHGNFTEHDYQMRVNDTQVAAVHKNWLSVRDTLGLSITSEIDHRIVLGALVVIEHLEVTERKENHRSYP